MDPSAQTTLEALLPVLSKRLAIKLHSAVDEAKAVAATDAVYYGEAVVIKTGHAVGDMMYICQIHLSIMPGEEGNGLRVTIAKIVARHALDLTDTTIRQAILEAVGAAKLAPKLLEGATIFTFTIATS